MKDKTLYDLNLHETLFVGDIEIMRVPSGWLYTFYREENILGNIKFLPWTTTFVPYTEEFKEKEQSDEN